MEKSRAHNAAKLLAHHCRLYPMCAVPQWKKECRELLLNQKQKNYNIYNLMKAKKNIMKACKVQV